MIAFSMANTQNNRRMLLTP